jgi:hypothetical protein
MIQRTTWATSIAKTNLVLASNSRNLNLLLGLLGAGALATGAVATGKYLTRKDPKSDMGKIKLKLPGSKKDPNTAAEVELPIDMPGRTYEPTPSSATLKQASLFRTRNGRPSRRRRLNSLTMLSSFPL